MDNRVKDTQILRLVEQISEHYRANISNRYLRPHLLQLQLDKTTWDQIELLTEKMELFRFQGFHLDDLYRQIYACARFVEAARNNIIPTLRSRISSGPSGPDKILRDMAANNFTSNLQLFADLLNDLYLSVVDFDKRTTPKGRQSVYSRIPELANVGRLLVG